MKMREIVAWFENNSFTEDFYKVQYSISGPDGMQLVHEIDHKRVPLTRPTEEELASYRQEASKLFSETLDNEKLNHAEFAPSSLEGFTGTHGKIVEMS